MSKWFNNNERWSSKLQYGLKEWHITCDPNPGHPDPGRHSADLAVVQIIKTMGKTALDPPPMLTATFDCGSNTPADG